MATKKKRRNPRSGVGPSVPTWLKAAKVILGHAILTCSTSQQRAFRERGVLVCPHGKQTNTTEPFSLCSFEILYGAVNPGNRAGYMEHTEVENDRTWITCFHDHGARSASWLAPTGWEDTVDFG